MDRADTATNALATQSAQLSDGSSCEERACWQAGSKPHGVTIVTATPVVSGALLTQPLTGSMGDAADIPDQSTAVGPHADL